MIQFLSLTNSDKKERKSKKTKQEQKYLFFFQFILPIFFFLKQDKNIFLNHPLDI